MFCRVRQLSKYPQREVLGNQVLHEYKYNVKKLA
ncbi:hypothetical protein HNQ92_004191 [Rhabdobacter roseus]|uniref:Uncharacterized protein n=1 Tax=Rhabdobacter roseus TaxID=1655419 RepID=A0A840TQC1_9BACT|nr:hypothetical protein [Rhabdobacter roseus]